MPSSPCLFVPVHPGVLIRSPFRRPPLVATERSNILPPAHTTPRTPLISAWDPALAGNLVPQVTLRVRTRGDAAEALASAYVEAGDPLWLVDRSGQGVQRSGVCDALMRPMGIVESLELPQSAAEVALAPDQRAVQQLTPTRLHPPLHGRVHSRHLDPAEHDLDPRVLQDGVEQLRKLAVPVPDHETRSATHVLQVHDEILRRLDHPDHGRVRGRTHNPDAAAGVLDPAPFSDAVNAMFGGSWGGWAVALAALVSMTGCTRPPSRCGSSRAPGTRRSTRACCSCSRASSSTR